MLGIAEVLFEPEHSAATDRHAPVAAMVVAVGQSRAIHELLVAEVEAPEGRQESVGPGRRGRNETEKHGERRQSKSGHVQSIGPSAAGIRGGPLGGQDRRLAMLFQFFTRWSAVRQASACTVSVGFRAPLVPIVDAPSTPRLGASWEKPKRLSTLVSALSPMRVPPYAWVEMPIAPPTGPRCIAIAPASRYHCSILS